MSVMRRIPKRSAGLRRKPSRTGLWAEVDPGFYVGNDRGRFLGSVTTASDGYSAFGATSEFIGRFDALDLAKAAVVAANPVEPLLASRTADPAFP